MSGLSASMWTSVSGLLSHSKKMQVVGNNLANVSTIGFKSQRMDFNDYLYTSGASASGSVQMGAGASVYALLGDFSQGSLESTNSFSDLAIDGKGFFGVRDPNSTNINYSRAGDFYFNENGQLVNPQQYVVQGRPVDNTKRLTFNNGVTDMGTTTDITSAYVGGGSPQDILFESWNINAQRTTHVATTGTGLLNDISNQDKSTSMTSPLTALFDSWNANAEPPLAGSAYAQSSSMKVYDEGGSTHELTIYYDAVALERLNSDGTLGYTLEGLPAGCKVYEYLVTIPPDQDMRSYGGEGYDVQTETWTKEPTRFYDDPVNGTCKNAGILASGVLIFDSAGNLIDQTAYTFGATATPAANNQVAMSPDSKNAWQPTKISNNGYPTFTANFSGQPLANSVSETMTSDTGVTPYSQAEEYIIELDMGLKQVAQPAWNNAQVNSVVLDANNKPYFTSKNANVNGDVAMADGTTQKGVELETDPNMGYYYVMPAGQAHEGEMVFGDVADPNNCTYGDKHGYYTYDGGTRVYGTTAGGNNITYSNGKYVAIGDPTNTEYQYTDGITLLNKGANNNYCTKATTATAAAGHAGAAEGNDVYGIITITGQTPQTRAVLYDAGTGQYYYNKGNVGGPFTQQFITDGLNDARITTNYSAPTGGATIAGVYEHGSSTQTPLNNAISPVTATANNSLASLMTQVTPDGAVVNLNTNAATMTAAEKQDNAIVANKDTFVNQTEQDGYGSGRMSNMEFDDNGVLYVTYNNGVTLPMWQLCIYDFENYQGLYREGGNLYSATSDSGNAMLGVAGDNGFGRVIGYSIEQSNVDMTTEFVQMISTQRGFQANSKGVTTTDTMLETVINMKR